MSAHSLPIDPSDWPDDPFALLGVERGASEADIKRAYTRLIRKYKPDHSPSEFRRVREAYETALEQSKWFRDAPVREPVAEMPFPLPRPESDAEPPSSRANGEREPVIDPAVRHSAIDAVERAWADAVNGLVEEAYAALVTLNDAHPTRADLPLRLYWLLALRPALDHETTRHEWLAQALVRARLTGPALELYRRELATDAEVGLFGPYVRLIERSGARGPDLLAFASLRLAFAGPDQRWALLELDLEALAARASDLDDGSWFVYLTDLSAWAARNEQLIGECKRHLDRLKHLELSHAWALDRMESRQELWRFAGQFRQGARVPEPIARAVAVALLGGSQHGAVSAAVAWAAQDPTAALRACDLVAVTDAGRWFMQQFAALLDEGASGPAYPSAVARGVVRAHLERAAAKPRRPYQASRGDLLAFLLAERLSPEELTTACLVDPDQRVRELVRHISDDNTLRFVYRVVTALD